MTNEKLRETARKKIIVALDVPTIFSAQPLVKLLAPHVGMFKIGKQLFTSCGPAIIEAVKKQGGEVFLDLKYHDIPNTVAMAGLEAGKHGVKMFNFHALGGSDMMIKTVELLNSAYGNRKQRPKILAVTILTSSTEETLREVGIEYSVKNMVSKLAYLAKKCGVDGVVCSPQEISLIREVCGPKFLIVTPGVRPVDSNVNDQKRIATPGAAVTAGADYLVIGRPIIEAADPVEAAQAIITEIMGALINKQN